MTKNKKTASTYKKVASHNRDKAAREWALGKNGEGGHHFKIARDCYARAKECDEKAHRLEKKSPPSSRPSKTTRRVNR